MKERPAESCLERGNPKGHGLSKRSPLTPKRRTSFLEDSPWRLDTSGQWESGARQFWAMAAWQLGTLLYDGGWNRIQQPWDVIELFSTGAHVSLAVSSAGGRAAQPYDGTPAAREHLFEDVESWKPRLIVAYLLDWTPGVSELALELVRRQRAGGREIFLRYP